MSVRDLLANASYNVGEWVIDGPSGWSDGWVMIKGGQGYTTLGHARSADAALIVAAVNEYEALLDIADAAREATRRPFGQLYERDHYRVRELLAALDKARSAS